MNRASGRSENWSRSVNDLHLDVDLSSRPRRRLEAGLRAAIRSGRLPVGARLPASRALAADLSLARGTVVEAYAQLAAEGWIVTRPRSGTVVAGTAAPPAPTPEPPTDDAGATDFDLRPSAWDGSSFPRAGWATALRRALTLAPNAAFGYGDPRGELSLRRELASQLGRVRGVLVDAEHLVITTGFTQGLWLVTRALLDAGIDRLALEDPCLPDFRDVTSAAGARLTPAPVDAGGLVVSALQRSHRSLRAALVSPARQFPLGVGLDSARRTELVQWARARDGYLIEDDYDGEFRYDRQPVGALHGRDPERVVYAGTTSKTLAPGLRLGWLAVPDRLLPLVLRHKSQTDGQTATVTQLAMLELLRSGGYDRHVRLMRAHYRRRRDLLLAALARDAPWVRVGGIAAGFSAALALPPDLDEAAVVDRAARRGLALHGLRTHRYHWGLGDPRPGCVIVNYGAPTDRSYPAALTVLCEVLAR